MEQMEQMEQMAQMERMEHMEPIEGLDAPGSRRKGAIVETLARLESDGESLADVAHDARNMVTALGLYCDLIEEPGVLSGPFLHYGTELRLVATASRRLVEKLALLGSGDLADRAVSRRPAGAANLSAVSAVSGGIWPPNREAGPSVGVHPRVPRWDMMPAPLIESLAAELEANRNLLAALAGPAIALTLNVDAGAKPVRLTGEDLTRVLVNLVKNAAEAMPGGGRIGVRLSEISAAAQGAPALLITIEDSGPGIAPGALESVFESGFTTRSRTVPLGPGWPASHRGLGLSISRSIVETAGGRICAANGITMGARIEIELPVRE